MIGRWTLLFAVTGNVIEIDVERVNDVLEPRVYTEDVLSFLWGNGRRRIFPWSSLTEATFTPDEAAT